MHARNGSRNAPAQLGIGCPLPTAATLLRIRHMLTKIRELPLRRFGQNSAVRAP
ncbi:hypothetical protein NS506_06574 [Nocardia seriolae]|uniref:Uncharacterized protein n=1 Tax=Nocardia seriolae TaxID=37332 RepID=A0ABC8B212_9NOCA|nr:hypothetical protein NS506_06574 [Nocardia seriolae]